MTEVIFLALTFEYGGENKIYHINTFAKKWIRKVAYCSQQLTYLRLIRKGTKLIGFFNKDGSLFTQVGEFEIQDKVLKTGLTELTNGFDSARAYAYFDYFRITKPDSSYCSLF